MPEIHYLNPVAENLVTITAEFERARALLGRGLALLPSGDGRRVVLLNLQAYSYWRQGQYAEGEAAAQQARILAQQAEDQAGLAESLKNLGVTTLQQGNYAAARGYQLQSLAIRQTIDDQRGIAVSLNNLGNIAFNQGDYGQVWDYYQQSISIYRAIGDQRGIAYSLNNLGNIARRQGDYGQARDYLQQSLSIKYDIGDQWGLGSSLNNLGKVAFNQGDYGQARDYYQQSLSIRRDIGPQWGIALALNNLSEVAYRQGDYTQAWDYHQQSLSIVQSIQAIPLMLMSLLGFAWLYLQWAQPARAGELCGLAQHHPAFNSGIQQRLDDLLPQLAEVLPPAELQAALERGKTLDLDTVVAKLLAEFAEEN